MPERIHEACQGLGCAKCKGLGVTGWEDPRFDITSSVWMKLVWPRDPLQPTGSGVGFLRTLTTNALRGIAQENCIRESERDMVLQILRERAHTRH